MKSRRTINNLTIKACVPNNCVPNNFVPNNFVTKGGLRKTEQKPIATIKNNQKNNQKITKK